MKFEITAARNSFDLIKEKEKRSDAEFINSRKHDLAFIEFSIFDAANVEFAKCTLQETVVDGGINTDLRIQMYTKPQKELAKVCRSLIDGCAGKEKEANAGFCELERTVISSIDPETEQETISSNSFKLLIHLSEVYEAFMPKLWEILDMTLHLPYTLQDKLKDLRYTRLLRNELDKDYQTLCNTFEDKGEAAAKSYLEGDPNRQGAPILHAALRELKNIHGFITENSNAPVTKRPRVCSVGKEDEVEEELKSPRVGAVFRNIPSRNG